MKSSMLIPQLMSRHQQITIATIRHRAQLACERASINLKVVPCPLTTHSTVPAQIEAGVAYHKAMQTKPVRHQERVNPLVMRERGRSMGLYPLLAVPPWAPLWVQRRPCAICRHPLPGHLVVVPTLPQPLPRLQQELKQGHVWQLSLLIWTYQIQKLIQHLQPLQLRRWDSLPWQTASGRRLRRKCQCLHRHLQQLRRKQSQLHRHLALHRL